MCAVFSPFWVTHARRWAARSGQAIRTSRHGSPTSTPSPDGAAAALRRRPRARGLRPRGGGGARARRLRDRRPRASPPSLRELRGTGGRCVAPCARDRGRTLATGRGLPHRALPPRRARRACRRPADKLRGDGPALADLPGARYTRRGGAHAASRGDAAGPDGGGARRGRASRAIAVCTAADAGDAFAPGESRLYLGYIA